MWQQKSLLTDAANGKQANGFIGRLALGEKGLQNVDTEREGHDSLRARPYDHAFYPQPNERHERAERLHDVSVVGTALGDHAAQLGIAVGAYLWALEHGIVRSCSTARHSSTRLPVDIRTRQC